jgi:hypothetical protein
MRLFLPHLLYTVWCLSKSYANNNNCKNQLVKKMKENRKKRNTTAQTGTGVWARVFNATLLARKVGLHPEGRATSQLDQGFLWFSLVPEQMLSWYPNSTLHCMLSMQPSQWQH